MTSRAARSVAKTPASWTALSLSTLPVKLSGPAAFFGFTDLSVQLTSCSRLPCHPMSELGLPSVLTCQSMQGGGSAAARVSRQPYLS